MTRQIIEPAVSLEEAKTWLYVDTDDLNDKLRMCIGAAISAAESYTNLTISLSSYGLSLPFTRSTRLPAHPVVSVDAVKVDGEILDGGYALDGDVLSMDDSVKGTTMEITFTAGVRPRECDEDIRIACLLIAADMFRNPVDAVRQLPTESQMLLRPHRYHNV